MGWVWFGLLAIVLCTGVMMLPFELRRRRRRARLIACGLDLGALVSLLPPELRDREYVDLAVSPTPPQNPRHELVGLIYRDPRPRAGNPPNVGLEVDLDARSALRVHAEGIGLGYK